MYPGILILPRDPIYYRDLFVNTMLVSRRDLFYSVEEGMPWARKGLTLESGPGASQEVQSSVYGHPDILVLPFEPEKQVFSQTSRLSSSLHP